MSRSWFLGGLTGTAVCIASALPLSHLGTQPATGQTADRSIEPTQAGLHPVFRFPTGGPYPNPTKMPGHLRPYASNAIHSGGATNGLHRR